MDHEVTGFIQLVEYIAGGFAKLVIEEAVGEL
jgi:hypothetical protein